jgi:hypothetical protein
MSRMLLRSAVVIVSLTLVSVPLVRYATAEAGLSPSEARKLIAHFAGIDLPSDAVRIKEVSSLGNSTVVVAQVETAFRVVKNDNKWKVAEIRTGNNRWEDVDTLVKALNEEKAARARAELGLLAAALELYKRERGFYLEAKSERALIDHLSPHYIANVVRTDPWHQPYTYEGTRDGFVLRSNGADEKAGTADDIVVSK